jgi:hypothetical protein
LVSVRRKCPNLIHKCPILFRALCPRFVCFHRHSGFVRIFLTSFFHPLPEIGHGGGDSGLRRGSLGGVRGGEFVPGGIRRFRFAFDRHSPSSASRRSIPAHNSLSFHQHRGKRPIGPLFSSTSWKACFRTYFLHLFSITSWNIPSFFPPRFFPASPSRIE